MGKMSKEKVLAVNYWDSIYDCCVITYQKESGPKAYASVPDNFSVKVGDTVWVFSDEKLCYAGFWSMVLPFPII